MSIPTLDIDRAWRRELRNLMLWLVLWLIAGVLVGSPLSLAFIGLAIFLAAHLFHAYRLHKWLVGDRRDGPEALGVWQEIFLEFNHLSQHNRKRKKQLRNIVKEFHASTAALPDGAVVLDSLGRIVWFNQAAAVLLALRATQDKGQRIANLIRHPRFNAYLADNDREEHEIEIPAGLGDTQTIALRIIPYGNKQRLLIARDVSIDKQLEETRRDFVANASHELRTPLTVLRGYLDMMTEETKADGSLSQWASPIEEMGRQSERMGRIIESLLKLARVEAEGYQQSQEIVDVPAMIERLAAETRMLDGHVPTMDLQLEHDLSLYGRPGELESIISNLFANAVQYAAHDVVINVQWWRDEEGVYLVVTDNGVGIAAEHVNRLTERFYRVDAARHSETGGTGLGLAIVKHCLLHHEADLNIDSEQNVGSTFTCRFPLSRAASAPVLS